MISKKQIFALFACGLVGWTVAQGLLALLPLYAVRLGADPALIGNYLAFAFLALTIGTMTAGWLSDKFQKRKAMIIFTGIANIPVIWLMGQTTAFWQLAVLTAIAWFFIGISFTTVTILGGLFAGESERGKVFGLLAVNTSLGALVGGFASGSIVDRWGYPGLFLVSAVCWAILPLIGLFIQDKVVIKAQPEAITGSPTRLGRAFYLLLFANVIAFGSGFIALLGRPLLMDKLGFDPAAISGVVAVGGAVSLPFPLLLGWLSDRVGRYGLIVLCFLVGAAGLIVLAGSVALWHFGISAILLTGVGISLAIGPALVTDLVPPDSLGTALAWYGFAPTTGGVIGFVITGYAIQAFGMTTTLIAGAILTLIAVALVIEVRRTRQLAILRAARLP